ncbi:MAG: phage portal protein [Chloroflexi bacterium]|nr:phage portal protein [Chloroflexota bacterium]
MHVGAATTLVRLIGTGARWAGRKFSPGAVMRPGKRSGGTVERANRAARVLVDRLGDGLDPWFGVDGSSGGGRYGDFYATSTSVHAAVRVRSDAVSRPPFKVHEVGPGGVEMPVEPGHPLQAILDRPNPFWTPAELWRATETYLSLWGAAFWGLERDETGTVTELWPLRPDRVRVLPDEKAYVRGFVYEHAGKRVAYLPEEIVWFRHFNPVDEFSGASAVAPSRAAVEMASSALLFNRSFFANSATPADLAITTDETPTDDQVAEFYERWEARFSGPGRAHRPIVLSRGMDAKRLGLSHREMEFIEALKWSVEEVARAFGVPKAFLGDLQDATLANIDSEERFLWRNTIVPELRLLEDAVNRTLSPLFKTPGGPELKARFDLGVIEALQESENERVDRLVKLVGAGVLTVNEVRAGRGLGPVDWGDRPMERKPDRVAGG